MTSVVGDPAILTKGLTDKQSAATVDVERDDVRHIGLGRPHRDIPLVGETDR